MLVSVLWLALGLLLLVGGGRALVQGAGTLARRLGVSELVVGMTVVAFGTSLPELLLNLVATVRGSTDLAFGNVIGSNIANIALILGISSLICPLRVHEGLVLREIPMLILASAVALVVGWDPGLPAGTRVLERADGLVLLLLFGVFLYYTVAELRAFRPSDRFVREAAQAAPPLTHTVAWNAALCAGGLVLLIAGGQLGVHGAVSLASAAGVSQNLIGLTIVAVGTSLPELTTSAVAAYRRQDDIAVGNVVGSNLFNLLFVLGVSATVRPLPVPAGALADLLVMTAATCMLLVIAHTHGRRIVRGEGAVLVIAYLAYVTWRAWG